MVTMGKINIKSISSNFQKDCKGDKCLICNNKLNYNNGKVLNLYKSNTTVSIRNINATIPDEEGEEL